MDWKKALGTLNRMASKVTETVAPILQEALEEIPDDATFPLDDHPDLDAQSSKQEVENQKSNSSDGFSDFQRVNNSLSIDEFREENFSASILETFHVEAAGVKTSSTKIDESSTINMFMSKISSLESLVQLFQEKNEALKAENALIKKRQEKITLEDNKSERLTELEAKLEKFEQISDKCRQYEDIIQRLQQNSVNRQDVNKFGAIETSSDSLIKLINDTLLKIDQVEDLRGKIELDESSLADAAIKVKSTKSDVRDEFESMKGELDRSNRENIELRAELEQLNNRITASSDLIQFLREENRLKEAKLSKISEETKELKLSFDLGSKTTSEEIAALINKQAEKDAFIVDLNQALTELNDELDEKHKKEKNLVQENELLRQTVREQLDQLSELQTKNSFAISSQAEVDQLQSENLSLKSRLERSEQLVHSTEVESQKLKLEYDNLTVAIQALSAQFEQIKLKNDARLEESLRKEKLLEKENQGLLSRLQLLNPRLERADSLKMENDDLRETIQQLQVEKRRTSQDHNHNTLSENNHFMDAVEIDEESIELERTSNLEEVDHHVRTVVLKKLILQYFCNSNAPKREVLKLIANMLSLNNREMVMIGLKDLEENGQSFQERFKSLVDNDI